MSVIDDYLSSVGEPQRIALEHVCAFVRAAVPDAQEATSYGMPAFKVRGRSLLGFTVSKGHMSLHPFSPDVIEGVKADLDGFRLSKGTIRFSTEKPVPDGVLRRIIEARLAEIMAAK